MKSIKAVILCAGKSTRTYPLTAGRNKSLLLVGGKTLIEHILDSIRGIVKEAVLVVADGSIKEKLGEKYDGINLAYTKQSEPLGTGHALLRAKNHISENEKFLVIMGDNLYPGKAIEECVSYGISILGQKVKIPENFGVLETDGGFLKKITEKPKDASSNMINTGLYVLNERIFSILKDIKKSGRGEYELTEAVNAMAAEVRIRSFYTTDFIPVVYPWDVLKANRKILAEMKGEKKGDVEKNVHIKGEVTIGEGTVVKSGAHIEGPVFIGRNCIIGPNAHIRPNTTIGNNVKIGGEVVNSVIMDNTSAKHMCYIGHSVIGENVNIAAGTVTADYRHDGEEHYTIVDGRKINTGLRKLGAFIGDGVKTGINTSIYPGRKIWPGFSTRPGETVKRDMVR